METLVLIEWFDEENKLMASAWAETNGLGDTDRFRNAMVTEGFDLTNFWERVGYYRTTTYLIGLKTTPTFTTPRGQINMEA